MIYLTLEDALFVHAEQLRLFGGAPSIREPGLLESALSRPQSGYYVDLIEQAAVLWGEEQFAQRTKSPKMGFSSDERPGP